MCNMLNFSAEVLRGPPKSEALGADFPSVLPSLGGPKLLLSAAMLFSRNSETLAEQNH